MNTAVSAGGIPDSSAILAAKKKREQMRKGFNITENDDGFIPLDEEEDVCLHIYTWNVVSHLPLL